MVLLVPSIADDDDGLKSMWPTTTTVLECIFDGQRGIRTRFRRVEGGMGVWFVIEHRLECSAQPDMDGARLPLDRIGMKSQIFDRRPTEEKSSLGTWSDNRPGPCHHPLTFPVVCGSMF